jgi:uncharacterized membrane protein YbhN (UPF0104 family)
VPNGIGVRETVLVAVFAGYLSGGDDGAAYALAGISRLLMTLGDIAWAGAAVGLSRGRRADGEDRAPDPERAVIHGA